MVTPLEQGCAVCSTHRKPQEAEFGLLCYTHSNEILNILNDVELCLYAVSAVPGGNGSSEPVSSSKPESKSPANDTVLVHLDPRTAWSAEDGHGAYATLVSWAELAREAAGVEAPASLSIATEAAALRSAHSEVCASEWVVEYREELRAVQRRLRQLCGLSADKPIGPCPDSECDGRAFTTMSRVGVECRTCKRTFTAADMIEMSRTASQRLVSREHLSELTNLSERTIRRRFEVIKYVGKKAYYDLDDCFTSLFGNE